MSVQSTRPRTGDVTRLLRDLLAEVSSLDVALDYPAVADATLRALADELPIERAALYAAYPQTQPVLIGLYGCERAPWLPPVVPDDAIIEEGGGGLIARASTDLEGRATSTLMVPVAGGDGQRAALLMADRPSDQPFSQCDLRTAVGIADRFGDAIDAALLFAWLRAKSELGAAGRRVHEIHNGVAQDLVALGFQIDSARLGPLGQHAEGRAALDGIRGAVTQIIADLREEVGDLQASARPTSGLGATIIRRLHQVGVYEKFQVRTTITDCGIRPPAAVEAMLYRLAIELIGDAAVTKATTVDLQLHIDHSAARLVLAHDGTPSTLASERFHDHPLLAAGGAITLVHEGAQTRLEATAPQQPRSA